MSQPSSDLNDPGLEFETYDPAVEGQMPEAPPAPVYRPQGFSIYTVMLIISFVCLLIATILFFNASGRYT